LGPGIRSSRESGGFTWTLKRRLWIFRNTFSAEIRSARTWSKVGLWLLELVPILAPVVVLGVKGGILYTAVIMAARALKAWNHASPAHMQLLRRNYGERKLKLYALLQDMQRRTELDLPGIERFQKEALDLIANYVRDHRADYKRTQIYVNLLVEDGNDLVVVRRDEPHRARSARYPKQGMLAWKVLQAGDALTTGNVYADFPETPAGKPYRSILALPIVVETERTTVGVVSIDSSRPYHFESDFLNLVKGLMPYVALLAWTLRPEIVRRMIGAEREPAV
jgi:hypothetical protein